MEKLNLHSPDFTQANIEKLAELFPNCVTETRAADGTNAHDGYTNNKSYPLNDANGLLSVAYYDDYDFNVDGTAEVNYTADADYPNNFASPYLTGKVTGVKTRNISSSNAIEADWYYSYPFYDDRDRGDTSCFRSAYRGTGNF